MVFYKGRTDLGRAVNCHATTDMLENYSLGRLSGSALEQFEEHLLICQQCQERLAAEDAFTEAMHDAAMALGQKAAAPSRWMLALWPKPAWAFGLAALALLIFAGAHWPSRHGAPAQPAVVLLQAMRGSESQPVASGRPLTLAFDLTDLPQLAHYKLEVVDAGGRPVFQATAAPDNSRVQAVVAKGLPGGAYFARIYAPSGELLREYALTVRR